MAGTRSKAHCITHDQRKSKIPEKISATTCELDKQGRILIPQVLREKASLDKDITLLGVGDHVEIWNSDKYNEKYNFDDEAALEADWEGLGV